ncbi:MAG: Nif3-like dinuclear metal center hexameric protein [Euryarchaeota archaeon]|nr:Nif3-like dinuclear metal center hexameric protein [Euryarchaeota archaeon]
MLLKEIVEYLDDFLDVKNIQDSCKNGLEVEGKEEVTKIGFAVDACMESFRKAAKAKCDLLMVHHGLFWGDMGYLRGILYKKISMLVKHGIALYAAHLPLDIHPDVGNNVQLAKKLDLTVKKTFCEYKGHDIGVVCENDTDFNDLLQRAQKELPTTYLNFTDTAERIGIITGSGGMGIEDAVKNGCDTFVTGEIDHPEYRAVEEYGINLICGGHYNTETVGPRALMNHIQEKFGIDCEFLHLTGMESKMLRGEGI